MYFREIWCWDPRSFCSNTSPRIWARRWKVVPCAYLVLGGWSQDAFGDMIGDFKGAAKIIVWVHTWCSGNGRSTRPPCCQWWGYCHSDKAGFVNSIRACLSYTYQKYLVGPPTFSAAPMNFWLCAFRLPKFLSPFLIVQPCRFVRIGLDEIEGASRCPKNKCCWQKEVSTKRSLGRRVIVVIRLRRSVWWRDKHMLVRKFQRSMIPKFGPNVFGIWAPWQRRVKFPAGNPHKVVLIISGFACHHLGEFSEIRPRLSTWNRCHKSRLECIHDCPRQNEPIRVNLCAYTSELTLTFNFALLTQGSVCLASTCDLDKIIYAPVRWVHTDRRVHT